MVLILLLLALAGAGIVETVLALRGDGYGRGLRAPRSHPEEVERRLPLS